MGCASGTVKCLLNTANLFLALIGILFIVMASLSLNSAPMPLIYLLYIIGGVNFLAAILGCCGICNENVCVTSLYAVMIAAALAIQIYNKIKPVDLEEIKRIGRDDVLKKWNGVPATQAEMDKIQQSYQCCGAYSPSDYSAKGLGVIPPSCYADNYIKPDQIFTEGCVKAAERIFASSLDWIQKGEWVGMGVNAVMLLFAIYLIIRFRNKQDHYRY